jgi:hypothetical protein
VLGKRNAFEILVERPEERPLGRLRNRGDYNTTVNSEKNNGPHKK